MSIIKNNILKVSQWRHFRCKCSHPSCDIMTSSSGAGVTIYNEEASRLYAELLSLVICTMCGRCADDICHPPVKSRPKSHSRVIRMSSACCPHIICTSSARCPHEISTWKIFPLKEQTALLKIRGKYSQS